MNRDQFVDEALLSVSDAELEAYRDAVNPNRHVKDITEFMVEVNDYLFYGARESVGDQLPWEHASRIGFRPGEVTLWMGINGHGKSAVTSQAMLAWALKGRKSCIASFEMYPRKTVERMLLQAAGAPNPTHDFSWDFFAAMKGKLFLYDRRDRVDVETLYRVIRYCAVEKGISHFVIDSLMKCVRGEDDYNGQKDFVSDLCTMAKELSIHIHLVHHVRKAGDEKGIPGKFDAKGSGAITDLVDQVITVWRNKGKEADREQGKHDEAAPDFLLICDKNRHGSWEGKVALWGDSDCWHFRGTQKHQWTRGYEIPKRKLKPGAT